MLRADVSPISFLSLYYYNCLPPWRAFPCYCWFVSISAPVCPWQVLLLHRMECFTPRLTFTFIILTPRFSTTFFNVGSTETSGSPVSRRAHSTSENFVAANIYAALVMAYLFIVCCNHTARKNVSTSELFHGLAFDSSNKIAIQNPTNLFYGMRHFRNLRVTHWK